MRNATSQDMDAAIDLGQSMWQESYYADLPFDRIKVGALGHTAIDNPSYFCQVASFNGQLNGFFLGYVTEYFFNFDTIAMDLAVFVKPDARGSSAFFKLLFAFQKWAQDKGVREICLAHTTGVKTKQTKKLYSKLGYNTVGSVHKKRVS